MSLFEHFIDSLVSHYDVSQVVEIIKPFQISGRQIEKNVILCLNQGQLIYGEKKISLQPGSFYFIPAGKILTLKYGSGDHLDFGNKGFENESERSQYLRNISCLEDSSHLNHVFSYCRFDVMLYDALSFIELLGIPDFTMPPDPELSDIIRRMAVEQELNKLGGKKIRNSYLEQIVIHICRYMDSQPVFGKYLENLQFLTDRRLVDIVNYIQRNLEKDLSNKMMAEVAFVSEDYVGQFFKTMTGKNLQDYVENQRLERALNLLQTHPDNVQEIAHKVGFKDAAYFSRRFKIKFGFNANAVRQQRNQVI